MTAKVGLILDIGKIQAEFAAGRKNKNRQEYYLNALKGINLVVNRIIKSGERFVLNNEDCICQLVSDCLAGASKKKSRSASVGIIGELMDLSVNFARSSQYSAAVEIVRSVYEKHTPPEVIKRKIHKLASMILNSDLSAEERVKVITPLFEKKKTLRDVLEADKIICSLFSAEEGNMAGFVVKLLVEDKKSAEELFSALTGNGTEKLPATAGQCQKLKAAWGENSFELVERKAVNNSDSYICRTGSHRGDGRGGGISH